MQLDNRRASRGRTVEKRREENRREEKRGPWVQDNEEREGKKGENKARRVTREQTEGYHERETNGGEMKRRGNILVNVLCSFNLIKLQRKRNISLSLFNKYISLGGLDIHTHTHRHRSFYPCSTRLYYHSSSCSPIHWGSIWLFSHCLGNLSHNTDYPNWLDYFTQHHKGILLQSIQRAVWDF